MDIVNDATRSSSLYENNGKESSSPPQLPTVTTINSNLIDIRKGPRNNRGNRQGKEPKEKKQLEIVPNVNKFRLRLILVAENMFTRNKSGVIINRLKGKITAEEYETSMGILDNYKSQFIIQLDNLVIQHNEAISSGFITMGIIDDVLTILKPISLKEKNINQQNKLKQKIISNLAASEIRVATEDPVESLRKSLLSLTIEQRSKVLSTIPLKISSHNQIEVLSGMML